MGAVGIAVLAGRFAFGVRLALRLCRGVLSSVHACCLSRDKQDGLRYLAFLFRRVEIAIRAFSRRSSVICLGGFTSGLCVYLWRSRRVTGDARNERTGLRGWRRGLCALLRRHIGFAMLSAGSTLGLRAPNLRQRVFDSLDSLHAAAGLCWCVFAAFVRFCVGALALLCFPRGVRWGCAPQTCAKEPLALWTLFF